VASDAIDFTRPASLFVSCPASLKECGKVMAQNQHRAFVIAGWKSSLEPCAHGIFMNAEQIGDLLYRVAAMDFDKAIVGVAFSHDGYPPLLALRFGLIAHFSRGCHASRFQLPHQIANF